jgi:hypothetical protein
LQTMHDQVSILVNPSEPISTPPQEYTSLMLFSSAKDFSARVGFSGDRTTIVTSSRVWMYGKWSGWMVSELSPSAVEGRGRGDGERDTGIFGFLLCRRIEGGRRFVGDDDVCGVHGALGVLSAVMVPS